MGFSQTAVIVMCLVVLVVVFLLLTSLMMRRWKISNIEAPWREKFPPGPKQLPIVGNLHQVGELPHIHFHKLSLRYGPLLFLRFGSTPVLVVSSSSMARKLFIDNDLLFLDRNVSYAQNKLSYGSLDVAFSPYGQYWKQLRRICSMELMGPKRVESLRAVREEEVELLVTSIRESSSSPVNLSSMLLSLVNNMVCRSAFGDRYRERDNEQYSMGRLQELLTQSQALLRGMTLADYFPWLHWANRFSSFHSKLESNFCQLDEIFSQLIEKHQDPDHRTKGNFEDLVDVLLKVEVNDPSLGNISLTPNHIKAVLMDIFVAGTDPTAAALVWAMVDLMKNPAAMKKAQEELRKVCGNKERVEEGDLQQLKYLNLVVKECLRLHPPSPLPAPRQTRQKCVIDGYTIPAKTVVFINARAIALDKEVWPNPEKFIPERFADSNLDYKGTKHLEMVPFGAGRRGCPGICFAERMIGITLSNLLHRFDWCFPQGMEAADLDMEEAVGLMNHKKAPLYLVAIPHENNGANA